MEIKNACGLRSVIPKQPQAFCAYYINILGVFLHDKGSNLPKIFFVIFGENKKACEYRFRHSQADCAE